MLLKTMIDGWQINANLYGVENLDGKTQDSLGLISLGEYTEFALILC